MYIHKNERVIGAAGVLALVALTGAFLVSGTLKIGGERVSAVASDTATTYTQLEVRSVINISAPSQALLNCDPGATASAATLCTTGANISVSTNNITGYSLQMNTTNGYSTNLTNAGVSPSATIPTLDNAYATASFPSNSWGYTGGSDQSEVSGGYDCATKYCPVEAYQSDPSSYGPNRTLKVTDGPDTASLTPLTFGAKVDISKPSGTYSTSVTFTAVANSAPLNCGTNLCNIVYNGNTGTGAMTASHTNVQLGDSITLMPSNFYKTGYGFAGWSIDPDAGAKLVDGDSTNDPMVYGPMQTTDVNYDLTDHNVDGTVTLYAVWIPSAGSMQSFTTCSNLTQTTYSGGVITPGSVTALTDSRDSNTYAVARLADGKCWMIENLRLNSGVTLDATNTHNPADGFTQLPASSNSWCNASTEECYNTAQFRNSNTASPANPMTGANQNVYGYGNYYSWKSATAGWGTYSVTGGSVSGDICPYNWTLPTSGSTTATFGTLSRAYGGSGSYQTNMDVNKRFRTYPNNFLFSGYVNGSSVVNRGSVGFWWSKSANSAPYAYDLGLRSAGYVSPSDDDNKWYGFTVRCVAGS